MRFRVSKMAEKELDEIFVHWARNVGLDVADRLVDVIEAHFALLGKLPHAGRSCEEIAPSILSFPVGKGLVSCRKAREIVSILHVFDGARDQVRAFAQDRSQ